jgi:hypothetical protein
LPLDEDIRFRIKVGAQYLVQSNRLVIETASKVQISGVEDDTFFHKSENPQSDHHLVFTNEKIYALTVVSRPNPKAPSSKYFIPLIDTKAGVEHPVKFVLDAVSKVLLGLPTGSRYTCGNKARPLNRPIALVNATRMQDSIFQQAK